MLPGNRKRYGSCVWRDGLPARGWRPGGGKPGVIWRVSCDFNKDFAALGLQIELIDGTDLSVWETALAESAKLVFLKSPSNPVLDLIDIKAVATLSQNASALIIVDNVSASPPYQSHWSFVPIS